MEFTEANNQRLWLLAGHVKKLSYCNSLITALYNKNPTMDKLDTTFEPINADGTCNYKIVDSTSIGIIPGSLSDNFNFCYGDPSDPKVAWRNPHEREVIEIFGRMLGLEPVSGYLTSGGSEANLAAIWWSKLHLTMSSRAKINEMKQKLVDLEGAEQKNYKEIYETQRSLKKLYAPVLVCTKPPHTHYSVIKVAQILELKTLFIESNEDGSMNTASLRAKLTEFAEHPYLNLIVNLNFGTQTGAAFDDVFEIRKTLDEVKSPNWNYRMHLDAAFYGPTLPVLKQYGDFSTRLSECGIDTVTISLWKFLGVQVPCGVALSTKPYTDKAFEDDNFVEYVQMQDKVALVGTRSGIAAASALNVMKSFKMNVDTQILKNVIDYDLELASYLVTRLELFYPKEEIKRVYFNVIFPKSTIPDSIIFKYMLMRVGTTHLQSIILINVNKALIDEFIEEVRQHLPLI